MEEKKEQIRIAAVGDLHVRETDRGKWKEYFAAICREADILVLAGDLTDTGDEDEAALLVDELKGCTIPMVGVLGNHDYEKGRQKIIKETLAHANIQILDGESTIINGVGFAGVKGFGGGFDAAMLSKFGEEMMKLFVQEAVDEALKLDRALARLGQHGGEVHKIAIMHYAPISATVEGEPLEIYPFLGSSRLLEPVQRHKVEAVFHGHAHKGKREAQTPDGISVWNVSLPLLAHQDKPYPFHLLELEATDLQHSS
ncbi:metallophosphoesterase [Parapedobacter pyrenivorans]|uniref:Metallophosphoesterase n=1 Tax=Parapedobacter pyrenivorans TaxID=1305674 RepID=A0A917I2Y6_9SPHI|nr:metallophosphoesterase [Parapedobacter pyrenivorans]GGH04124.1 metallophosphoesterase [Parapedobacter pyrenivorans]